MDPKDLEDEIQKIIAAENRRQKMQSYWDLGYLLILAFLLVGSLMPSHREQAAIGMVFFAIFWTASQVMSRGLAAMSFLFFTPKNDDNNKEK